MDLRSLRALYNVPGESSATMDGKILQFRPEVIFSRVIQCPDGGYVRYEDHVAALAQARADEREACAKVAEKGTEINAFPDEIARMIRARRP